MKENNEVMQGDNNARGPSASGADLSVVAALQECLLIYKILLVRLLRFIKERKLN